MGNPGKTHTAHDQHTSDKVLRQEGPGKPIARRILFRRGKTWGQDAGRRIPRDVCLSPMASPMADGAAGWGPDWGQAPSEPDRFSAPACAQSAACPYDDLWRLGRGDDRWSARPSRYVFLPSSRSRGACPSRRPRCLLPPAPTSLVPAAERRSYSGEETIRPALCHDRRDRRPRCERASARRRSTMIEDSNGDSNGDRHPTKSHGRLRSRWLRRLRLCLSPRAPSQSQRPGYPRRFDSPPAPREVTVFLSRFDHLTGAAAQPYRACPCPNER